MDIQLARQNRLHKAMKTIASSRPGASSLSHSLHHLDRIAAALTRGQTTLTSILTGLPVVTLTTCGARTGKPRAVPLIGVPMGGDIVVIASNWGQSSHPAWYRNVMAHSSVVLSYRGQSAHYTAREAEGPLRDQCWAKAVEIYPGYDAYKRRAGARRIPVILLSPVV